MGKFGFDHVHLVGSDLDASERFYRDMFGAETVGGRDASGAQNLMMRLDGINLFTRSPAQRTGQQRRPGGPLHLRPLRRGRA